MPPGFLGFGAYRFLYLGTAGIVIYLEFLTNVKVSVLRDTYAT